MVMVEEVVARLANLQESIQLLLYQINSMLIQNFRYPLVLRENFHLGLFSENLQ